MRVGPGWLYTGALSPAESVEAQRERVIATRRGLSADALLGLEAR